jgi:hypothetical protein
MIGVVFSLMWAIAGMGVLYYSTAALLDLPAGDEPPTLGKKPLYLDRILFAVQSLPQWIRWVMLIPGPLVIMFFGAFAFVEMFTRMFVGMVRWISSLVVKRRGHFANGSP